MQVERFVQGAQDVAFGLAFGKRSMNPTLSAFS